MTHLTADELVRWRDAGADEDRERVLTHLTSCDACRRAYADHVRHGAEAGGPTRFAAERFVARGIAAYPRTWWRRRAVWLGVPASAAAVMLLVLFVSRSSVAPLTDPTAAVRGGEIVALSPAGDVRTVSAFAWASPFAAVRYRVIVRNAAGTVMLSEDATGERLAIGPDAAPRFGPGSYTWTVEAIDRDGQTISASRAQAFQVVR